MMPDWIQEFDGAVTVCDPDGVILYMNDRAARTFERWGGRGLVGRSLIDCHPEPARSKLVHLMEHRQKNAYTIEKAGVRKLIYQVPWFDRGTYAGFVELSLELPADMPHFVRQPPG